MNRHTMKTTLPALLTVSLLIIVYTISYMQPLKAQQQRPKINATFYCGKIYLHHKRRHDTKQYNTFSGDTTIAISGTISKNSSRTVDSPIAVAELNDNETKPKFITSGYSPAQFNILTPMGVLYYVYYNAW